MQNSKKECTIGCKPYRCMFPDHSCRIMALSTQNNPQIYPDHSYQYCGTTYLHQGLCPDHIYPNHSHLKCGYPQAKGHNTGLTDSFVDNYEHA